MEVKEMETWLGGVEAKLEELDDVSIAVKVVKEQVDAIEQRVARGGAMGGPAAELSIGAQVAANDGIKALCERARNGSGGARAGVTVKATITSATSLADGSAGDLLVPHRDQVVQLPRRPLRLRDLLPVIQVSGNSVEVPKQTGFTNNAAPVAEAALKPQSEFQWDMATIPVRTIAHWALASRQILDDVPMLMGYIDSDLRFGLDYAEDNQILNGSGTGQDLNGIYTQATVFAAGALVVATPNMMDAIAAAILQAELTDVEVDGIVMHPSDWTRILLIKESGGIYLAGDPVRGNLVDYTGRSTTPTLHGRPVALSKAIGAGNFLVGDFKGSATLYDRWQTRVEVSTEDSDNFRRNLVTILAEKRVALNVKRVTSFIKGSFATAITDLTS